MGDPTTPLLRRFYLHRTCDISGISGVGAVAFGVQFADGSVVVHWQGDHSATHVWAKLEDVIAIHGHEGATEAIFIDDEETFCLNKACEKSPA